MTKGVRTSRQTVVAHNSDACPKYPHHAVTGMRSRTFSIYSASKRVRSIAENETSAMRSLFCKDCKTIFIDSAELPKKIFRGLLSNAIYLVHGSMLVELFSRKSRQE